MKRAGAVLLATLSLLVLGLPISARMDTIRIIIEGGALRAPIEIADPDVVRLFHVGAGPGNFLVSNGTHVPYYREQSFIVDWSREIARPPADLAVYKVSFVTTRTDRARTSWATESISRRKKDTFTFLEKRIQFTTTTCG
jgi:hypothetical protein